jgi:hypothetical protein
MGQHLRTGIAVALLVASIAAGAGLALNPRFVDELPAGLLAFVAVPLVVGAFGGIVLGRALKKLAELGSNEDPVRAYKLLWASFAGFLVFFAALALLPPFIGIFSNAEWARYGGSLLLAFGLAYVAAITIRAVANRPQFWIWPLLLALPMATVLAGSTEWGRGRAPGARTLVLAFPGLSWNVAEELIDKGEMPNITRLRREGAWGDVEAVPPLLPSVVWTSVATGKTCEDHGVISFTATAQDIQVRRVWDIFAERGWSVGLFGWPLTWPPSAVDGFVVPDVSDAGTETHPRELRFIRELAMSEKTRQPRTWGKYCRYSFLSIRYGARLSTLVDAGIEILLDPWRGRMFGAAELFDKRKLRARLNCDFFMELRRRQPVEFAAYFTNIVGVAQRYFWKYHEPGAFQGISPADISRYGTTVHDSYRLMDELLGRILRDSRENDLVVVVSDHGAVASTDSERSLTLRVEPMLKNMGLKEAIEATNLGARTYLRMRPGYEGNPDRIRRLFETARLDRGSRRAFGAWVDEWGNVVVTVNPELVSHTNDTILFQGGRCQVSEIVRAVDFDESGQVTETGTLVLAGKGVYPGRRFEGASLLDLVPTLLVLNGFDLAADLAGDVIKDALDEELGHRIPGVIATYETDVWDLVGEQN